VVGCGNDDENAVVIVVHKRLMKEEEKNWGNVVFPNFSL
jgi:hypothetical protein